MRIDAPERVAVVDALREVTAVGAISRHDLYSSMTRAVVSASAASIMFRSLSNNPMQKKRSEVMASRMFCGWARSFSAEAPSGIMDTTSKSSPAILSPRNNVTALWIRLS